MKKCRASRPLRRPECGRIRLQQTLKDIKWESMDSKNCFRIGTSGGYSLNNLVDHAALDFIVPFSHHIYNISQYPIK